MTAWPDGRPLHPENIANWFEQHTRAAGLPRIRLHDVRHSYATAALKAGISAKVISERPHPGQHAEGARNRGPGPLR